MNKYFFFVLLLVVTCRYDCTFALKEKKNVETKNFNLGMIITCIFCINSSVLSILPCTPVQLIPIFCCLVQLRSLFYSPTQHVNVLFCFSFYIFWFYNFVLHLFFFFFFCLIDWWWLCNVGVRRRRVSLWLVSVLWRITSRL